MKTFTASNGVTIKLATGDNLFIEPMASSSSLGRLHVSGSRSIAALREFFRAERDEELGLWRDPERPGFTVKLSKDGKEAIVHYEPGNGSTKWTREEAATDYGMPCRVARKFFEEYVDPDRPWESAKAGDLWILTMADDARIGVSVAIDPDTESLTFFGDGIGASLRNNKNIVGGELLYRAEEKA